MIEYAQDAFYYYSNFYGNNPFNYAAYSCPLGRCPRCPCCSPHRSCSSCCCTSRCSCSPCCSSLTSYQERPKTGPHQASSAMPPKEEPAAADNPLTAIVAASFKLPDFYCHRPEVWFSYVESQFLLRGINDDAQEEVCVCGVRPSPGGGRAHHRHHCSAARL